MGNGIRLATQRTPPSPDELIRFVRHTCKMFRATHPADFDRAVGAQASALGVSPQDVYVGLFPDEIAGARPEAASNPFMTAFLPANYVPGRMAIASGSRYSGPCYLPAISAPSSMYAPPADSESEAMESVESESEDEVFVRPKRGKKRKTEGAPFPMDPREQDEAM
jgi:hypothetical protein